MKQFTFALLAIFLASAACNLGIPNSVHGSGNIVTQSFDVGGFDQIELRTIGEVYIEHRVSCKNLNRQKTGLKRWQTDHC